MRTALSAAFWLCCLMGGGSIGSALLGEDPVVRAMWVAIAGLAVVGAIIVWDALELGVSGHGVIYWPPYSDVPESVIGAGPTVGMEDQRRAMIEGLGVDTGGTSQRRGTQGDPWRDR